MGSTRAAAAKAANAGAIKAGAALALAAGAGALGVYMLRNSMGGSGGYMIGSSPAKSEIKRIPSAEKSSPEGPLVRIFFGSQTGTAEEFAKMLAKEAGSQGINAVSVDLESFEPEMLPNSYAIFLVATYGEGDPTDNARGFYVWLTTQAGGGSLEGCSFAVFGLGNTQYEHYNSVGKVVDSTCEKHGGNRMLQLGLGDDDSNIRGDFDEWMDQLWPALREQLGMEQSSQAWLEKGVEYKLAFRVWASESEAKRAPQLRTSNSIDAAHAISSYAWAPMASVAAIEHGYLPLREARPRLLRRQSRHPPSTRQCRLPWHLQRV